MDESAARQLSALARVSKLLAEEGIPYAVFGGWAVDFYTGSVSRPHDDVDIAVWSQDVPRIVERLRSDGWTQAPSGEQGGTGYERKGVRLELTYLVKGHDGSARISLGDEHVPWFEESLSDEVRELHGVRARLITLRALRDGKSSPREDPDDAIKDRADYLRLRKLDPED
jgi:hypothetical protein